MGSSLFGGGTAKSSSTTDQESNQDTKANSQSTSSALSNTAQNANQTGYSNGTSVASNDPWQTQLPYLMQGLNAASNVYNSVAPGAAGYSGDLYARLTPAQQAAMGNLNNYAAGGGQSIADLLTRTGSDLIGNYGSSSDLMRQLAGLSMTDPTQANISAAGQYANNPYTQGMIQSAISPIQQQLHEVALTGLNTAAGGTGNYDSSRAGVTEALLRREAGNQESNVAANILGNQYNQGLNLAENARVANMGAGENVANSLANLGQAGTSMANQGYQTNLNNLQIPLTTGQLAQEDQQHQLDANYQQYQIQQQQPWNALSNYWNIVGHPLGSTLTSNNANLTGGQSNATSGTTSSALSNTDATQNVHGTVHGTTETTSQQPGPGILGGLMGLASGVGSFFAPGGIAGQIGSFFK